MFKGKFKTGYDQREIPEKVVVVAADALHVGQLVTYTPATADTPAYIAAAAGATAAAALTAATHIIAQSDVTMGIGDTEFARSNYKYDDKVKATAAASSGVKTAEQKLVALFAIHKEGSVAVDVIPYEV